MAKQNQRYDQLHQSYEKLKNENDQNEKQIKNISKENNSLKEQKARLQRMLSSEQSVRQSSFVNLANTIDHNDRSRATVAKKSTAKRQTSNSNFENDIIELQQQNLVMQENLRKLNLELMKEKNKENKVNFHNSSIEAQKVQAKMGIKEQQAENQFTLKKIKTMASSNS